MDISQAQILKKYLDLFIRRKFLIILAILVSGGGGLVYYLTLPKVYQATSLLSYQQQRVNPNTMSPDLAARIKDTVSTLTQIVTSRSNLEKIVKTHNLYVMALDKNPMEDVVDEFREKIVITPSKRGDTFVVSYSGTDPQSVVRVTNSLASKFVEENLKYREERATETSAYTGDELSMAKVVLDEKEAIMRDYKLKYFNEMPEQRQTNVSQLIALQEQYQNKQLNIQELERTKILVQEQINIRKNALARQQSLLTEQQIDTDQQILSEMNSTEQTLINARRRHDQLLLKYTEKHPDIKKIKKIISGLEAELNKEAQSIEGTTDKPSRQEVRDQTIVELELQLKEIKLNIISVTNEKKVLLVKIKQLEEWVSSSPIREAEWSALTREYGELKRHYDYLVSQNLQAKSALNLERRQKGSQFKIEDSARFPEKPFSPNFFKIVGMVCVAGTGCVVGLILLVDFFDQSFRFSSEIEQHLGVSIVCTLPYIETEREVRKRKVTGVVSFLLLFLCGVCLIGALFYYWKIGEIII